MDIRDTIMDTLHQTHVRRVSVDYFNKQHPDVGRGRFARTLSEMAAQGIIKETRHFACPECGNRVPALQEMTYHRALGRPLTFDCLECGLEAGPADLTDLDYTAYYGRK